MNGLHLQDPTQGKGRGEAPRGKAKPGPPQTRLRRYLQQALLSAPAVRASKARWSKRGPLSTIWPNISLSPPPPAFFSSQASNPSLSPPPPLLERSPSGRQREPLPKCEKMQRDAGRGGGGESKSKRNGNGGGVKRTFFFSARRGRRSRRGSGRGGGRKEGGACSGGGGRTRLPGLSSLLNTTQRWLINHATHSQEDERPRQGPPIGAPLPRQRPSPFGGFKGLSFSPPPPPPLLVVRGGVRAQARAGGGEGAWAVVVAPVLSLPPWEPVGTKSSNHVKRERQGGRRRRRRQRRRTGGGGAGGESVAETARQELEGGGLEGAQR